MVSCCISSTDKYTEKMEQKHRIVGLESQKTYAKKIECGFFERYLSGDHVLDIGFAGHDGTGQPITPNALGIDVDFPGYDGIRLPFDDASQDAIYSSHCYEHIADHIGALRDWHRVLKVGGYIVIVVPHSHLFERKEAMPSIWNEEHKRFLTSGSLLTEIEHAFPPNTFRVRHLRENDEGFDYSAMPQDPVPGCYEIELVLEKLPPVDWLPDNGNARHWPASAFRSTKGNDRGVSQDLDLAKEAGAGCWIFGPYIPLSKGHYVARFYLEGVDLCRDVLGGGIEIDIARNLGQVVVSQELSEKRLWCVLDRGWVEIEFNNGDYGAVHEFRIHILSAARTKGTLRFFGVNLLMTRRTAFD